MTAATGSPTWRTVSRASAKRGGSAIGEPSRERMIQSGRIGAMRSAAMSAPVKTATTPGDAIAAAASIRADAGMGVRRAHQHAVQGAGQLDVGDEAAAAGEEAAILDAAQRRADALVVSPACAGGIH